MDSAFCHFARSTAASSIQALPFDAVRLFLDGFAVVRRRFQGSLSQRAAVARHENVRKLPKL
jgi:hypothetical protein